MSAADEAWAAMKLVINMNPQSKAVGELALKLHLLIRESETNKVSPAIKSALEGIKSAGTKKANLQRAMDGLQKALNEESKT